MFDIGAKKQRLVGVMSVYFGVEAREDKSNLYHPKVLARV
jgi:hypothetical protein